MSEKILKWDKWFSTPTLPFYELLKTLDPEEVKGTDRWQYVTMGFLGLYYDIIMMFRLIGQIMRRLNRDFLNLIKEREMYARARAGERIKWEPSDPEDESFNVLLLAKLDFTSLISFFGILLEKVARLLHRISVGDRPGPRSFTDWRKDIINGKFLVPSDLEELMRNATWYDEFYKLRNRYTIHYGYSVGSIINYRTLQLLSHYEEEIMYDINDVQRLCDDIYQFFEDLNKFLCDNFDKLPIRIIVKTSINAV